MAGKHASDAEKLENLETIQRMREEVATVLEACEAKGVPAAIYHRRNSKNVSNPTSEKFPDSLIDEIAETIGATTDGKKRQLAHYLREMPADMDSESGEPAGQALSIHGMSGNSADPAACCRFFPNSLIDKIAETIGVTKDGGKRRLAHYLRDMPADLEFYRTDESVSPWCRVRDRLRRIAADCRKLVERGSDAPSARLRNLMDRAEPEVLWLLEWQYALRLNRKNQEAAIAEGSARDALDGAFSDLSRLRACAWAASVRASQAVREGGGGDRHGADVPFDEIALQLAVLYYEVTGEKPSISTDGHLGKPSGKFVAFLGKCLEELGYPLRPHAIRSRFRRLRERYPDDPIIGNSKNIT